MRLPEELLVAIQAEVEKVDRSMLARASAQLTRQYQAADFSIPPIKSEAHRSAYLAVRLPAIYAANRRVFSEVHRLAPQAEVGGLLDLGAGPGTALFAASEVFPALRQATLMESDEAWLKLGSRIAGNSLQPVLRRAEWVRQDLRNELHCPAHDLVVISYALGELPQTAAAALLHQAWACATKFLVIIEPGTVRGFAVVNAARSALIAAKVHILAPCPHQDTCPMTGTDDWCHFSQRLERTSQHRQLKGGALAYEDEKFSYLVASRESYAPAGSRIVRHPQKHSGHVQLTLCASHGIETRTVTRSQRQDYKLARKAEWGGAWKE